MATAANRFRPLHPRTLLPIREQEGKRCKARDLCGLRISEAMGTRSGAPDIRLASPTSGSDPASLPTPKPAGKRTSKGGRRRRYQRKHYHSRTLLRFSWIQSQRNRFRSLLLEFYPLSAEIQQNNVH